MPFLYVHVCDLLEQLGELVYRDVPLLIGLKEKTNSMAIKWLSQHCNRLNEHSVDSQAVIAMLMPQLRTGWDYGLDAEGLEMLIARVLNLPKALHEELRKWRCRPIPGDLGACVQRVMDKMTWEIPSRAIANKVTVEDVDQALTRIASHNQGSSAQVRSLAVKAKTHDPIELLGKFYKSLGGREAKWLTRFILKEYGPVQFPSRLDFSSHNVSLPRCVQMNAEISVPDAFPVLREGTSVIRGAISTANRFYKAPVAITEAAPRRLASAPHTVKQLSTLPTTIPQPLCSALLLSPAHPSATLPRTREPLASLTTNIASSSSSFRTVAYEPSLSVPAFPTSSQIARTRRSEPASASQPISLQIIRSRTSHHSQTARSKSSTPLIISGTGTCQLTSHRCPFTNCIIILSPCISKSPYIVEQLLPWHGCRIVTSLRSLSHPLLPRHCHQVGKKYRKIALVESNRIEETVEFLNRIGRLDLRRRKREDRQWVEVYDWRLLECVAKVDRGKELGYDPWRRCWMGAA